MTGPLDGLPDDAVLTPGQVATLFGVIGKTVLRWAQAGAIPSFQTPGGHRRFYADDVRKVLEQGKGRP